jgi:hypothetical protein
MIVSIEDETPAINVLGAPSTEVKSDPVFVGKPTRP